MLEYRYVPPLNEPQTSLLLVLHGLGDSMAGWMPVGPLLAQPGLGMVFVNAPTAYYQGFSWFVIPGMTDPFSTLDDMHQDIARSRSQLSELIVHLQGEHGLAVQQIILMGFSQGCLMVLDQCFRADQPFAGVLALSGRIGMASEYPQQFGSAARQQPIYRCHGRYDPVIPLSDVAADEQLMQEWGLNCQWELYDMEHSLDQRHQIPAMNTFLQQCCARACVYGEGAAPA